MRIVFAGTPAFAAAHLLALLAAGRQVVAAYTQPDRPAGRGRRLSASAVKQVALEHGLALRQPATLREAAVQSELAASSPDVIVVVAYGLLLPPAVLAIPPLGCINVHASLLPRWRGAAPIQRAILAGDCQSGVSIMRMDEGLDTGPVLRTAALDIRDDDTTGSLQQRLVGLGTRTLLESLADLDRRCALATPQDGALATYAPKVTREEARLDWSMPARELERRVRAFDPAPGAWTTLAGAPLRIWQARALEGTSAPPGQVLCADRQGVRVATGEGDLLVKRLQLAGGRPVAVADYLNAHRAPVGQTLGH